MLKSVDVDVPPGASCVAGQRERKRGFSRFSLRRLLYASPLVGRRFATPNNGNNKQPPPPPPSYHATRSDNGKTTHIKNQGQAKDSIALDGRNGSSSKNSHFVELHQANSKTSVFTSSTKSIDDYLSECSLCLVEQSIEVFYELSGCGHRCCLSCLKQYLKIEISESRVWICCPECAEPIHPNEIRSILDDERIYEKYEDFMVRRVLAVDPDTRWCPAPDCRFAVIASECASCPKLKCERPGCNSYFCYHCKAEWHPNQTCDAARAQRSPNLRSSSISFSQDSQHRDDIKPCPRCQVLIVKLDDGSCNHMMCSVCGAEFCWLCMKEISDLHYLSPSGCTFWGKKPWSRKKKILWQLGTLVGAPVGIALIAGIAVPAMIIGIPVWVGRKLFARYKTANKHKRNAAVIGGVIASVLISPILAGLAVGIGVPILLFYVYGVVPVSLCRSGGCGVTTSATGGVRFDFDDENKVDVATSSSSRNNAAVAATATAAASSVDAVVVSSGVGAASTTVSSDDGVVVVATTNEENDDDVDGKKAKRQLEVHADVADAGDAATTQARQRFSISSLSDRSMSASIAPDDGAASTRALAGSMLNYTSTGSVTSVGEDCVSERVRFDDNVSFITPFSNNINNNVDKTSMDGSYVSNDSIYVDITLPVDDRKQNRKTTTTTSSTVALKNLFFQTTTNNNNNNNRSSNVNNNKKTTKQQDEANVVIELPITSSSVYDNGDDKNKEIISKTISHF